MHKKDLIREIAKKARLSLKDTESFLNVALDCISSGLRKNKYVKLVGFGTFKKTLVNVTKGINPKTGDRIDIDPYTRITFSAGQNFKDKINSKKKKNAMKKKAEALKAEKAKKKTKKKSTKK